MKKDSTSKNRREQPAEVTNPKLFAVMEAYRNKELRAGLLTIGLDLGDRSSRHCVLDEMGEVIGRGQVGMER